MIKQYHFPNPNDVFSIEKKRNELFNVASMRKLDLEEIDWLDWAETVLACACGETDITRNAFREV